MDGRGYRFRRQLHGDMVTPLLSYGGLMKIALNLNDQVLRQARDLAARDGITLTRFVEDALRERLAIVQHSKDRFRMQLKTIKGDRPPNVDIDNRDAPCDVMDQPEKWSPPTS